ncbi:hypothetical protein ACJMK2_001715, partial [Sinanodonta woodiana]
GQTVIECIRERKESKVSQKGEADSKDGVLSTSIQKGVPCSDPKLLCQILQKSQQAISSSQPTLEANCLSVGLKFHGETPADGNCFFEAVSSQLRRLNCVVQQSPQQLRQEVVAFMRNNRVIQASEGTIYLESFIYNESFDVYCTRMARDKEWADHVVVVAMAKMLQMDIMIVTSSPSSGPENIVWVVGKTAFQDDPILIGHVWEYHYLSLQPIGHVVIEQELPGQATHAQTDVTIPAPLPEITQSPITPTTAEVLPTSSYIIHHLREASEFVSTAADMQAPTSVHTSPNVLLATTSPSTPSTTTGSTPCPRSTLVTAVVMQDPPSGSTTTDIMQASASGSKEGTTTGYIPCPSSTPITADVMQVPTSASTPDIVQASASGSKEVTITGYILSPNSTPIAANVVQAQTSASTTDIVQASSSDSKEATTTGSIPCSTSTPITENDIQAPTSASTTDIMQASSSGSTYNAMIGPTLGLTTIMQASLSGSKQSANTGTIPYPSSISIAANVTLAPTSESTADSMNSTSPSFTPNAMLASVSGSTVANAMHSPTIGSTAHVKSIASSSIPSTTGDIMPVMSSCYTIGCILQPQASSSIPASANDVRQISTVDDTDRFMHIACLLVNIGSKVLRRLLLFHTVTPTCTLDQYLAKNIIVLDNLRKRKILNKSQIAILFPPGGSTNLGDYDISLLSALFTNIVPNISQQQLNMIQFLRDKRNEIFAHANLVAVNLNDYQTIWNDICRTLEALSKQCNDPDFENEISKEIQEIQVSTVQSACLIDTHQTHPRRIETLERLVQYLISSHVQESNKDSDDSDS